MKIFVLLVCSLVIKTAFGQEADKMHTDRPGETQTPFITTAGYWQAEIGVTKYGSNNEELLWHHPQLVVKKGVSKWLALRLQISEDAKKMDTGKHYINGLPATELGFKARIVEQKGIWPLISLYTQVGIPALASNAFKTPHVPADIRILFGNKISDKFQVNYNAGVLWDGDVVDPAWQFSLEPELEITKNCELMLEYYGKATNGIQPESYVNVGFSYVLSDNAQADIFGGKGLTTTSHNYFVSAGFSFRFK